MACIEQEAVTDQFWLAALGCGLAPLLWSTILLISTKSPISALHAISLIDSAFLMLSLLVWLWVKNKRSARLAVELMREFDVRFLSGFMKLHVPNQPLDTSRISVCWLGVPLASQHLVDTLSSRSGRLLIAIVLPLLLSDAIALAPPGSHINVWLAVGLGFWLLGGLVWSRVEARLERAEAQHFPRLVLQGQQGRSTVDCEGSEGA
ncbi:hypothetical protein IAR50_001751 [Cryptococcus sp. DSM 104548]